MRVLLQEHDEPVRALIRPMLEVHGNSVIEAKDPWDAARIATLEAPDIVLLSAADVYYRGLEVPRALAAGSPRSRVLLIGATEPHGARSPRLPVDGYLPYPFDAARLMNAIQGLLADAASASRSVEVPMVGQAHAL
jgi:DNA-binding response OmpR family regulator